MFEYFSLDSNGQDRIVGQVFTDACIELLSLKLLYCNDTCRSGFIRCCLSLTPLNLAYDR
jgi:hypothetical protein